MIIDLFQDKRVYINQKKKGNSKNALPQIKYSPSIFKKFQDEMIYSKDPSMRNTKIQQPLLSNILISKRIGPPMHIEEFSPAIKKKPAQSSNNYIQYNIIAKKQTQMQQQKRNSTSLQTRPFIKNKIKIESFDISLEIENKNQIKFDQLTYVLGKGNNNQQLIRQILNDRKIWREVKWGQQIPNLKWLFSKEKQNYKKLWSFHQKRTINHFQFNQQISAKDNLIKNLQIYCQTKKIQLFNLTPVTFIIDFDDQYCQYNMKQFLNFFHKNDPRKITKKNTQQISYNFVNKFMSYMTWQNSDIKKKTNNLSNPINSNVYFSQNSYIWLLKPTGLNRGRGIQIFDSLQQLQKILTDYMNLMNRKKLYQKNKIKDSKVQDKSPKKQSQQSKEKDSNTEPTNMENSSNIGQNKYSSEKFKLNTCSFIIQKYVEKPFLIEGRKFDIRVWVLVTQSLKIYFFKEGYIRTSTEQYSTEDIGNYYIHLTNNAIQKNSQNYGEFQSGNQLSYRKLSDYLGEQTSRQIFGKIKQISYMAFSSVKKKLNQNQRKFCFQLFGLDYIIDSQNKVWLIEINENPCLQCSSPLLTQLIPRMVSDAFKLTIDQIYQKKPDEVIYSVQGYSNNDNLWESMGMLAPNMNYSPQKKTAL